jgi:hypothetical protein
LDDRDGQARERHYTSPLRGSAQSRGARGPAGTQPGRGRSSSVERPIL